MERNHKGTNDVDLNHCYKSLDAADSNDDQLLSKDEYAGVIHSFVSQKIGVKSTPVKLPHFIFRDFDLLACRCRDIGGTEDCCLGDKAVIPIEGSKYGETPDPDQELFLKKACISIQRSVDQVVLQELKPSVSPEISLIPVMAPKAVNNQSSFRSAGVNVTLRSPAVVLPTSIKPTTDKATSLPGNTSHLGSPFKITTSGPNNMKATRIPSTIRPATRKPSTHMKTFGPKRPPTSNSPMIMKSATAKPTVQSFGTFNPVMSSTLDPTVRRNPTRNSHSPSGPVILSSTTLHPSIRSNSTTIPSSPFSQPEKSLSPLVLSHLAFLPSILIPSNAIPNSSSWMPSPIIIPSVILTLKPSTSMVNPSLMEPLSVNPSLSLVPTLKKMPDVTQSPDAFNIVKYDIAYRNGLKDDSVSDLNQAMDLLASNVAAKYFSNAFIRSIFQLGKDIPCPVEISDKDLCQQVNHLISLTATDPKVNKSKFIQDLQLAINEGDLASYLLSVDQNSNVYILTGLTSVPITAPAGITILGIGIIAGAACFVLVILFVGWLAVHRQRKEFFGIENVITNLDVAQENEPRNQQDDNLNGKTELSPLEQDGTSSESRSQVLIFADNSSNEGSNNNAISKQKVLSRKPRDLEHREKTSVEFPSTLGVTKQENEILDPLPLKQKLVLAIEACKWKEVAIIAALLAAESSDGRSSSQCRKSESVPLLANLHASQIDALNKSAKNGDFSDAEELLDNVKSSISSSISSTTESKVSENSRKHDEYLRSQVEELIRRTVPEEIISIDELMLHYQGNEAELLEALRSLEERMALQRALQSKGTSSKPCEKRKKSKKKIPDTMSNSMFTDKNTASTVSKPQVQMPTSSSHVHADLESARGAGRSEDIGRRQIVFEPDLNNGNFHGESRKSPSFKHNSPSQSSSRLESRNIDESTTKHDSNKITVQSVNQLNDMIDSGDWIGLIEAASRLEETVVSSIAEDATPSSSYSRQSQFYF